jgi:D-amino-acid dehydrogenase
LLYAFGHQHLGLTLAPITADIVTALVAGKEPFMPIAPFDIARFGSRR